MSEDSARVPFEDGDQIRNAVRKRIQRFAQLRSVRRVLAPSLMVLQDDEQARLGRTLREALERLSRESADLDVPNSGDQLLFSSSLERLDRELQDSAQFLLECSDQIAHPQLRASLPRIQERHPGELMALLDLLLEDREGISRRLPSIEYIITLLSTEERDGRRAIRHDPSRLSPILEKVAAERLQVEDVDTAAFELELFQASALDPSDASSVQILQNMRQRKQELGIDCLRPALLRAIVTYNTRMFNRMNDDMEAARQSDAKLGHYSIAHPSAANESAIDEELGVGSSWSEDIGADESTATSVLDAETLGVIAEATVRRLHNSAIGSCTSERIALALDLSSLTEEDFDALRNGIGGEGAEALVARTILVGLLMRDLPTLESSLSEIGINCHELQFHWVPELDQHLQSRTSELLTHNAYDEACRLTETKTRFLYTSLSSLRRDVAELRDVGVGGQPLDAAMLPRGGELSPEAAAALGIEEGGSRSLRSSVRFLMGLALLWVLGAAGAALWPEPQIPEIHQLANHELASESGYILSAYRDGQGSGNRFVGRLDYDWTVLGPSERYEAAQEIAQQLAARGIADLMLFGEDMSLQIHFVDGHLRTPRQPVEKQDESQS